MESVPPDFAFLGVFGEWLFDVDWAFRMMIGPALLLSLAAAQTTGPDRNIVKGETIKFECEMFDRLRGSFDLAGMLVELKDPLQANDGDKLGTGNIVSKSAWIHSGRYEVFANGVSDFNLYSVDAQNNTSIIRLNLAAQKGSVGSVVVSQRASSAVGGKLDTIGIGFCKSEIFLDFGSDKK